MGIWKTCCMQRKLMLLKEISAFHKDCLGVPGSSCHFPHASLPGLPSSQQLLYRDLAAVPTLLKPLGQSERHGSPKALSFAQTLVTGLHFFYYRSTFKGEWWRIMLKATLAIACTFAMTVWENRCGEIKGQDGREPGPESSLRKHDRDLQVCHRVGREWDPQKAFPSWRNGLFPLVYVVLEQSPQIISFGSHLLKL